VGVVRVVQPGREVALGRSRELGLALGVAKEIRRAAVGVLTTAWLLRIDLHPAHRIDGFGSGDGGAVLVAVMGVRLFWVHVRPRFADFHSADARSGEFLQSFFASMGTGAVQAPVVGTGAAHLLQPLSQRLSCPMQPHRGIVGGDTQLGRDDFGQCCKPTVRPVEMVGLGWRAERIIAAARLAVACLAMRYSQTH